jgi:hypothetical protein
LKLNPYYRDSAELLSRAEAQLRARERSASRRSDRRRLIVVGGLAGSAALVALIALAVSISRGAGNTLAVAPTARVAMATDMPTEPPLPTITSAASEAPTDVAPTALPSPPPATAEPATALPSPSPAPTLTTVAPTATGPASSPTPAGETGDVVLADAFSGSGWANSSSAGWRVGYQGGRYRVAVDNGYGTIWSYRTAPLSDYSLGVDVQVPSGEGGVLLRFVDARNYLSYSVNPAETSYRLEQHSGGAVTVLAGGQSEAIEAGADATNRLVARLSGSHVELLINGQRMADLDAPNVRDSTRFGLLAIGSARDSVAFFDNLEIRRINN